MKLRSYLLAEGHGAQQKLAAAIGGHASDVSSWISGRRTPGSARCVAIERFTGGKVTRRDLRPDDWREIWPDLEEVEALRAQVAQLMERLRKYEPDAAPALAGQAPAAINSEATEAAHV